MSICIILTTMRIRYCQAIWTSIEMKDDIYNEMEVHCDVENNRKPV